MKLIDLVDGCRAFFMVPASCAARVIVLVGQASDLLQRLLEILGWGLAEGEEMNFVGSADLTDWLDQMAARLEQQPMCTTPALYHRSAQGGVTQQSEDNQIQTFY